MLKNSFPSSLVSGHDFSRADKPLIFDVPSGLQSARDLLFRLFQQPLQPWKMRRRLIRSVRISILWMPMHSKLFLLSILLLAVPVVNLAQTQNVDTSKLTEMRWRNVGPFRGGRTRALSGVPSQPNVFYVGAVNGGVWKSTDYGRTWQPIFDEQPTGSIGAMVVAPSDPAIVYVGSGEGLHRPISRSATVSINPPTLVPLGRTSACAMASRFPRWRSILTMPTVCSSPSPDIPTAPTPSVAFTAPLTVPKPLRRCSTKTRTSALLES